MPCARIWRYRLLTFVNAMKWSPFSQVYWCVDRSLCDKSTKIGTNDRYHVQNTGLKSNKCRSKMAAMNPRWPPQNYFFWHVLNNFCSLRSIQMSIFLELFKKNWFWPFIYVFRRTVTHSKIVRITIFFSTGLGHSN